MVVVVVPGVVIMQNRIVSAFRAAGATNPGRATTVDALAIHQGQAFRNLCRHEILRDAGQHRLYLDEPRWAAHRAKRRRFALRIVGTMVLAMLAVGLWAAMR